MRGVLSRFAGYVPPIVFVDVQTCTSGFVQAIGDVAALQSPVLAVHNPAVGNYAYDGLMRALALGAGQHSDYIPTDTPSGAIIELPGGLVAIDYLQAYHGPVDDFAVFGLDDLNAALATMPTSPTGGLWNNGGIVCFVPGGSESPSASLNAVNAIVAALPVLEPLEGGLWLNGQALSIAPLIGLLDGDAAEEVALLLIEAPASAPAEGGVWIDGNLIAFAYGTSYPAPPPPSDGVYGTIGVLT